MRIGMVVVVLAMEAIGCTRARREPPEAYAIDDDADRVEGGAEVDARVAVPAETAASDASPKDDAAPVTGVDQVDADSPVLAAPLEPITDAQFDVELGECFGDCQPYAMRLSSDGTYTGLGGKRQIGEADAQAIFHLVAAAFAQGFGRCAGPTDVQYTKVTYRHFKTVRSARYAQTMPCTPAKIKEAVRKMNALRGK